MMTLQDRLQQGLRRQDTNEVLRQLGYTPDNQWALARLMATVEGEFYGLDESRFDFRYSGADFLRALARILEIDPEPVEAEVARVQGFLKDKATAFQPFIWVDTHFRRTGQPIFALAACEPQRYLRLDWQLPGEPWGRQLDQVRQCMAEHWADTGGTLGIWGTIQEYWYFYEKRRALRLSPAGDILGEWERPVPGRATVTL